METENTNHKNEAEYQNETKRNRNEQIENKELVQKMGNTRKP